MGGRSRRKQEMSSNVMLEGATEESPPCCMAAGCSPGTIPTNRF